MSKSKSNLPILGHKIKCLKKSYSEFSFWRVFFDVKEGICKFKKIHFKVCVIFFSIYFKPCVHFRKSQKGVNHSTLVWIRVQVCIICKQICDFWTTYELINVWRMLVPKMISLSYALSTNNCTRLRIWLFGILALMALLKENMALRAPREGEYGS